MNKKKLMILGASILQLPAILKAKEMGAEVIAVDQDSQAIGFQSADVSLAISTVDENRIIEAAKKYAIDGILTIASDMPMRAVSRVVAELGLIGISQETAQRATNKGLMRECLREKNVPVPEFFRVEKYADYERTIRHFKSGYIVKPVDNSGSRGVFFVSNVNNYEMVQYAFAYSKKSSVSGELVVEEFMEGPEVSVETVSVDGVIHIIAITDKLTSGPPRFVEMGHSQPSQLPESIRMQIKKAAAEAVRALGIDIGPSHTEIIVTKEGPKIVEIGARLGGDCITTHLVPLSTGIDMVQCCIQIALGIQPDFKRKLNAGSAIKYFKTTPGQIVAIKNTEDAIKMSHIKQIGFVKHVGDTVGEINNSADRIGFVIAQSKNAMGAIKACEDAQASIQIEIA